MISEAGATRGWLMPGPLRAVLRGLAANGGSIELRASCSFLTSDEAIRLSRRFLPHGEIVYQGICASTA